MKLGVLFIAVIALAILVFCAAKFDATTTLFVGVAMVLVGVFSGAAVTLGVMTRRAEERGRRSDIDSIEVIRDDELRANN